ncbi:MAG: hypothetical protein ACPG4L_05765 [Candidatus Puniceispirillaceae bacterium]|jgi:hypothetical protein
MKAGEKTKKEENSLSSAAMSRPAGVSFLEALFIGLALMALIGCGLVHTIQKTHQTKISTVTENGEAIAQWLRSAYLLKQISTPLDNAPCAENSINTELACFQDIIDENGIFSTLQNPFFPERDSAAIIALFQGNASSPVTGKPCGELAQRFSILTASGHYLGKPRFWRGTILIYLREYTAQEQGLRRYFVVGFCDFKDRYQQLSTNIFLS